MSKSKKIVLGIITGIVLIVITLFILIITKTIPNPFLDTSDLLCKRENYNFDEVITFKFNWLGKSIFTKKDIYLYFESKEEADEYYNNYAVEDSGYIRENDNTIIFNTPNEDEKENYKVSRKKLLKLYNGYGFKCEKGVIK